MNAKKIITSLALVASLTAAATAQAEGKIYVGAKLGAAESDIFALTGDSLIAGVYGGYTMLGEGGQFRANLSGGALAIEGEALTTAVSGKIAGSAAKWDITSVAVYAAYRHPIAKGFYAKARAGVVHYTIDVDTIAGLSALTVNALGDTNTLAIGIGGGWAIGPGRIEADITTYGNDVLIPSIGFNMAF